MRQLALALAVIDGLLLNCPAFAAEEACTLITQAQVSAALEVPVNPGTPIAKASSCQWAVAQTLCQIVAGKM